uniref:Gasdermin-D isoform X3 n=1 Tax=Camelus bactrianus TaxID=9837 RepID=A0A9W3GE49_CAMBA|nr:gasdermin-D isoform X3 [Camelus bactrianus]
MASAFERVVKSVVQELDHSQELTPVNSLWSSAGFQPYCLLGRRPSSSWFWRPRYKCVSLSLRDILEPDAPEPGTHLALSQSQRWEGRGWAGCHLLRASGRSAFRGQALSKGPLAQAGQAAAGWGLSSGLALAVEQDGPFHFHETMDGQLKGSVKLAVPGQGKISGKAAGSSSSSASVNVCMLRVAPSTWEAMRRERRLRKPEHKILQMQKEVEITQTHKQEGSGQFALPGAICLQTSSSSRTRSRGPSAGHCRQAARVQAASQSRPSASPTNASSCQTGSWRTSWRPLRTSRACSWRWGSGPQVWRACPRSHVGSCWGAWGRCCRMSTPWKPWRSCWSGASAAGRGSLRTVQWAPSSSAWCSPPDSWKRNLPAPSPTCWELWLVRSLLEQSSPWQERRAVSLPPELLGSSWGAEAPSWVLLEECGLAPQAGDPQVCWEPEARCCTSALYACLALLSKLSPPC